jgi:hypothetical protein
MTDPITNRAVQILTGSRRLLVPLDDLYRELAGEGLMSWTDLNTFEALLADDERFELVVGLGNSEFIDPALQAELINRGFLRGPMVVLQERRITPELVILDILHHLQEVNQALEAAWQVRPPNDPEVEAELINLLMMGDMLERELRQALRIEITKDEHHAPAQHDANSR